MLLCGIIDELEGRTAGELTNAAEYTTTHDRHGGRLAYFFCEATDSRINNATAVLCGLICLFVDQERSLFSHVRKQYDRLGETLFNNVNTWFALSDIFADIIQDPVLDNVYVDINALDECRSTSKLELYDLLNLISDILANNDKVKWLISSRNIPEIEK
jgi:hypothetical protein